MKYGVYLCKGCDGCCVFCLFCDARSRRCSCMGSVSVSSCRCCTFVSCVHPVAVLNAEFCMTCSLLMLVEDAKDDHMEERLQKTQPTRVGALTMVWQTLCKLCLPLPPPAMGARLPFFGKPAMRTRWISGNAPYKSGRCRD